MLYLMIVLFNEQYKYIYIYYFTLSICCNMCLYISGPVASYNVTIKLVNY